MVQAYSTDLCGAQTPWTYYLYILSLNISTESWSVCITYILHPFSWSPQSHPIDLWACSDKWASPIRPMNRCISQLPYIDKNLNNESIINTNTNSTKCQLSNKTTLSFTLIVDKLRRAIWFVIISILEHSSRLDSQKTTVYSRNIFLDSDLRYLRLVFCLIRYCLPS